MDRGSEYYARFLAGDDDAFADIVREYKNPLMLYIKGIVGNIYTAEELTEDTFVRIAVRKPKYRENTASFKTWLFTIARNITMDHIRWRKRAAEVPIDEARERADTRSIEEEYIREEEKILVHEAMDALYPDYRQVLYLSYFEQLSNQEISKTMHKTRRQVENLLTRARTSLKNILTERGYRYEGLS